MRDGLRPIGHFQTELALRLPTRDGLNQRMLLEQKARWCCLVWLASLDSDHISLNLCFQRDR